MEPFAGSVSLIVQAPSEDTTIRRGQAATPEDAVRLGADAFAIVCFVRGATEAEYMQAVANAVREAERYEMPVICHIYPAYSRTGRPSLLQTG